MVLLYLELVVQQELLLQHILFGDEGLDMYLPGNGILFLDGIHATIANTAGVTITFT